jgi:hypothetical protein
MKDHDPVNSPSHYKAPSGGELVDMIAHITYLRANAIKYIFRAGNKYPDKEIEDLRKAVWCINKELSIIEQRQK